MPDGRTAAAGRADVSVADKLLPSQEIGDESAGADMDAGDVTLLGPPGGMLHDSDTMTIA